MTASVRRLQPRPRLAQSSQPESTVAAESATASAASSMPGWNQLSLAWPQRHQPRRASQLTKGTRSRAVNAAPQWSHAERPNTMGPPRRQSLDHDPEKASDERRQDGGEQPFELHDAPA